MIAQPGRSQNGRGLFFMVLAALSFALMTLFIRLGSLHDTNAWGPKFDVWETVCIRSGVMLIFCFVIMGPRGLVALKGLPPKTKGLLAFRGFVGSLSMAAGFHAALHLPLAVASLFTNSSVIFTGLFAYFILAESMNGWRIFGTLLGFSGITLILLNGVHGSMQPQAAATPTSFWDWVTGSLAGPLGALAYTSVRKMKDVSAHAIILSLALGGVSVGVLGGMVSGFTWPQGNRAWLDLGISSIFALMGQYFMTRSFQLGDAAVVSVGQYAGPIFAVLAGVVLFQEHLNTLQAVGIAVVIAAGLMSR